MNKEKVIIIGGGPCGMSCAIELQHHGLKPLIIEKANIVNSIYHFPTHQTFFSSSEKLEIGDIPFITEKQKPVRIQALAYYRSVADRMKLRINTYETVVNITKESEHFIVETKRNNGESNIYQADHVIVATGYYDQPNYLDIPGEQLEKVSHYFKEGHPYHNKDIVIIGGKNSAVDAALELHLAGARITVIYRGSTYSKSIKPWILPDFDALVQKDIIKMEFNAHVTEITENHVFYRVNEEDRKIKNDFVFAMTGYRPDTKLLKNVGVSIDPITGKPHFDEETMETDVKGLYVAGVVTAGYNNNAIFIENGRFHGKSIAHSIMQ